MSSLREVWRIFREDTRLFFYLLHNYFLSTYCVPGAVLSAGLIGVNAAPSFIEFPG